MHRKTVVFILPVVGVSRIELRLLFDACSSLSELICTSLEKNKLLSDCATNKTSTWDVKNSPNQDYPQLCWIVLVPWQIAVDFSPEYSYASLGHRQQVAHLMEDVID